MSSQTLYLKYRPQDFDSLVGQEMTRVILKNASKEAKLSHAYLFTGPRGTGKTSSARIVAKAINCTSLKEDGNPCNQCNICLSITDGRMVDIIEIDAASHTSVEDVRELIDKARFMPNEAKKKVYIIDEVHMLSKSAFNALLKTLEEPPEHVHFILATTEAHKVPETIISRCQKFDFKRFEIQDIVYRLKYVAESEKVEADIKALNLIAKISEGGLRDALSLFEKVLFENRITYENVVDHVGVTSSHIIEGLYEDLDNQRTAAALEKISNLYEGGSSLSQFGKDFIEFLREKMLDMLKQQESAKMQELMRWIEIFEKANLDLKTSIIPQLPLEMAAIKVCLGTEERPVEKKAKAAVMEDHKEKAKPAVSPERTKAGENQETPVRISAETPAPAAEKQEEAVVEGSFENIKKYWQRLSSGLSPSVKHAFKNAVPVELSNNDLTIAISSNHYYEVLKTPSAQLEIEKVIQDQFQVKLQIKPIMEKVESLMPESTASAADPKAGPVSPQAAANQEQSLSPEDVAALFGGDIVE